MLNKVLQVNISCTFFFFISCGKKLYEYNKAEDAFGKTDDKSIIINPTDLKKERNLEILQEIPFSKIAAKKVQESKGIEYFYNFYIDAETGRIKNEVHPKKFFFSKKQNKETSLDLIYDILRKKSRTISPNSLDCAIRLICIMCYSLKYDVLCKRLSDNETTVLAEKLKCHIKNFEKIENKVFLSCLKELQTSLIYKTN